MLLIRIQELRVWTGVLALIIIGILYKTLPEERKAFRLSFFLFALVSLGIASLLPSWELHWVGELGIVGIMTLLFVSIEGASRRLFAHTKEFLRTLDLFLMLGIGLISVKLADMPTIWLYTGIFTLISAVLLYERISGQGRWIEAAAGALVIGQILWIGTFLPFHPFHRALFGALLFYTVAELLIIKTQGELHWRGIVRKTLIFTLFLIALLATSTWSI